MNELLTAVKLYVAACDVKKPMRYDNLTVMSIDNAYSTITTVVHMTEGEQKLVAAKKIVECEKATTELLEVTSAQAKLSNYHCKDSK